MKKNTPNAKTVFTIMTAVLLLLSSLAQAELKKLDDQEMSGINAQAGISIAVNNATFYQQYSSISYHATDTNNSVALKNLQVSNGTGGSARFNSGGVDVNGDGIKSPVSIDVFTNPGGHAMVGLMVPDWEQDLFYNVKDFEFCGKNLGKLEIGDIKIPSYYFYTGPHAGAGFDIQFTLRMNVDNFKYIYNDADDNFNLQEIYLANDFTENADDDPTDPSTWEPQGNFDLGDMNVDGSSTYDPMTIDVVNPDNDVAQVKMNMPMQGSIRIENVHFGSEDFGPVAIDGLKVHKMDVRFKP